MDTNVPAPPPLASAPSPHASTPPPLAPSPPSLVRAPTPSAHILSPAEVKMNVALDEVQRCFLVVSSVARAVAFAAPGAVYGDDIYCVVTPIRLTGKTPNGGGHVAVISEESLKLRALASLVPPMLPVRFYIIKDLPQDVTREELCKALLAE